jgi:hypothetical protein
MAYSPDAASMVLGAFISAINSDLRRRARKRKVRGRLQTGNMTVVQRFGSSLNLNVHFHVIAMDGVYAQQPDGSMLFHPLPAPSDEDIARLARAVRMRFGQGKMALEPTKLNQEFVKKSGNHFEGRESNEVDLTTCRVIGRSPRSSM